MVFSQKPPAEIHSILRETGTGTKVLGKLVSQSLVLQLQRVHGRLRFPRHTKTHKAVKCMVHSRARPPRHTTAYTGKVFQTEIEWGKKDMLYACVLERGLHKSAG